MSRSAASYVNDAARFTDGIEDAVKAYAASKPWRGDRDQQIEKLRTLHEKLCEVCEVECAFEPVPIDVNRKLAAYCAGDKTLRIAGPISVTTYLWAFAMVLYGTGRPGQNQRMTFAVNLYKRAFPRSFRRADLSGPVIKSGK